MAYREQHFELDQRAQRLRDQVLTVPEVCIERATLMTESYMETEGQPAPVRRGKALYKILSEKKIRIEPGELLVGWQTSKARGAAMVPEISAAWIDGELDGLSERKWDPYVEMSEEDKRITREFILPYWKGKSLNDQIYHYIPQELHKFNHTAVTSMGFSENGQYFGHVTGEFKKYLRVGVKGILDEIQNELDHLDYSKAEDLHKYHELQGMVYSYQAVLAYAKRYSELARRMAQEEADETRKQELEMIADTCAKVPYEPAGNFYEALQALWFMFLSLMEEAWGVGLTFGRIDQVLYPYYKNDIEQGSLTQERATELLALLIIKMNGESVFAAEEVSIVMGGYPIMPGLTLGGVDADGNDAVNDLSYLFLDAEKAVGLVSDDFVIRVNPKNPKSFLVKALETAKALKGKMKFVSDKTTVDALMWTGIDRRRANDYISTGCHNPTVPSETFDVGGSSVNYPLMLELALNRGRLVSTGEQLGIDTGDPREFKTFIELLDAFEAQFEYICGRLLCYKNADLKLFEQLPVPLISSLYHGPIQSGQDIYEHGAYRRTHTTGIVGAPNVGDSLAAIKKTVFDDKTLTMERLLQVLADNLEGDDEAVYLLKKAPKFGNNDPYVDGLLRTVLERSCEYLHQHKVHETVYNTAGCLTMTANIPMGAILAASADGRKAGEPLSEGGISPHQGRNVSGLSASMASVAHLNQIKISHGSILNQRLSPGSVNTPEKMEKLADIVLTFAESGGNLVQFNFLDQETLLDAQKHPENYRGLLVRVATYSAYFVNLSQPLQEDIIARIVSEEL